MRSTKTEMLTFIGFLLPRPASILHSSNGIPIRAKHIAFHLRNGCSSIGAAAAQYEAKRRPQIGRSTAKQSKMFPSLLLSRRQLRIKKKHRPLLPPLIRERFYAPAERRQQTAREHTPIDASPSASSIRRRGGCGLYPIRWPRTA